MVAIGRGMGKKVAALITDMEQPLGRTVGNALEVVECIETLKGRGPEGPRVALHRARGLDALPRRGHRAPRRRARARCATPSRSGAGLAQASGEMVELQGGDPRVCDDPSLLPRAREALVVRSERDGRVARIACRAVGHAAMLLGAGARPWTASSTPRWASCSTRRSATGRDRRAARDAARRTPSRG